LKQEISKKGVELTSYEATVRKGGGLEKVRTGLCTGRGASGGSEAAGKRNQESAVPTQKLQ